QQRLFIFFVFLRIHGKHGIDNSAYPKKTDHAAYQYKGFKLPYISLAQMKLGKAYPYKYKGGIADKLKCLEA
ncbi:MAG: hypothetical protein JWO06_788, partial [Bacteroidota bacterium]|nr:hypothetical protein [Bacteroidota bacterium]